MSEWKLFATEIPESPGMLAGRGWMNLEQQPGFAQRAAMVAGLARMVHLLRPVTSITDLGCGDGSVLAALRHLCVPMWGYDLGVADLAHGRMRGLDLREADIVSGYLDYGELLIASEVAEHLADPVKFLSGLPGRLLILSSPSLETGEWHNAIHAWAWDREGYADMVRRAGWEIAYHAECDGGTNTFGGVTGPQRFQSVLAVR